MPDFKEIEARFREKYRFPDDETTNGSPSETILLGSLKRAATEAKLNKTSVIIDDSICKNQRLKNLVAMLWKGLQKEGFGVGLLALAIYNSRLELNVDKKVTMIITEIITLFPIVTDAELLSLRQSDKRLGLDPESTLSRNIELMESIIPTLDNDQILDMTRKRKAGQVLLPDRASLEVLDQKLKTEMSKRRLALEEQKPERSAKKSRRKYKA